MADSEIKFWIMTSVPVSPTHDMVFAKPIKRLSTTVLILKLTIVNWVISSVEMRVLCHGGGVRGVNWSLIGQEIKMVDEILPSEWPILNKSVIGQ